MPPQHGKQQIIIVKKVSHGHGGHHGGAWKVAYADFVTAMMAFFMVMWIIGMDQHVKDSIEGYFSNPVGYKKGFSSGASPISNGQSPLKAASAGFPLMSRQSERKQLDTAGARIKEHLAAAGLSALAKQVQIQFTPDGLRIELTEDSTGALLFGMASAAPNAQLVAVLRMIGQELAPLQNPVIVEGHTDAAPYSGKYSNWELSADRANAARRVIEDGGVVPSRIAEVRGLADRHLRFVDNPLDPRNRRITIVLPFVSREDSISSAAANVAQPGPSG